MKIPVFLVYSINVAVPSFLYRDTCGENVNITSMAYDEKIVQWEDQDIGLCSEKAKQTARSDPDTHCRKEREHFVNTFSHVYV